MAPASGKPGALVFFGHHMRTVPLSVYVIATLKKHFVVHYAPCSGGSIGRIVAIDWYFLDGKYVSAVEALARSLIHFVVG